MCHTSCLDTLLVTKSFGSNSPEVSQRCPLNECLEHSKCFKVVTLNTVLNAKYFFKCPNAVNSGIVLWLTSKCFTGLNGPLLMSLIPPVLFLQSALFLCGRDLLVCSQTLTGASNWCFIKCRC